MLFALTSMPTTSRVRPAQGVVCGLRGAAARDEDAAIVAVRLARPKEMRFGAPPRVVPRSAVGVEVVDRRRIGMTFVKAAHLRGDVGERGAFHTESSSTRYGKAPSLRQRAVCA